MNIYKLKKFTGFGRGKNKGKIKFNTLYTFCGDRKRTPKYICRGVYLSGPEL
jgi:hypothetical protein